MSSKKAVSAGSIAILGLGLFLANAYAQTDKGKAPPATIGRTQMRMMFVDENGDGINDMHRDHDHDGIPNCQDSDWKMMQDGKHDGMGNQNRMGGHDGNHKGMHDGSAMNNTSFRYQMGASSNGACGGTGSLGKGHYKGRG